MENNLPVGWINISPLDIAEKVRGVSYNKEEVSNSPDVGLIPIIRANNIKNNRIIYDELVYVPERFINKNQLLKGGDVVIAMSSGSKNLVGKTAQFFDVIELSFGTFCGVLRPRRGLNKKYFGYFFQSKEYRNKISELSAGTNINNLRNEHFETLRIPIPPLPEQYQIVTKLDTLFEKLESYSLRYEMIPRLLQRFRQSILDAAVSGKLTGDWREKNNINGEWQSMKATEACFIVACGSTPNGKPFFKKEQIPYLKVYNIVNQKIDFFYKPQYIKREVHEQELKRCKVFPNDVIINIVGPPLGKVAIVPNTFPEWNMNQALVVFRPKELLSSVFLYYVLCDGKPIKVIEHEIRGTVGQSNISLSQCRDFDLPVPPIQEQHEIVRRVELLFAYAEKIEARYTKAKVMLDRLPQAILAKAFRGELVPQNPNDEPASLLLERIKAVKEKQTVKRKRRS